MADIERIAPPVPTLPPPIGRGVGTRRQPPRRDGEREREHEPIAPRDGDHPPQEHIDEYV